MEKENAGSSTAAKGGAAGGGVAAVLGVGYFVGKGMWLFVIIVVVLLLVLLGGYLAWIWWRRKQQSSRMTGELRQQGTGAPRGISDPGQRARLDDLRKKFDEGVNAYKSRGKDLYSLPWCLIVGEPGSGKTEAIRHSNVGFPPGMQDEFQGVGGTINMNWWFTNQAVLLDTAGRLMFEEVKPGETSEWKEFLNLLAKFRPNCPVNGLLLVIPSDSLIKDSADDIQRKAGKIAQQLDVIQRTLDVRFPVFVLITKCDKILGFREFFDGLNDPQLQHQITGWSNPDPLDSAFRPDLVDQHIESVCQRLRRRRLALLRDPVPDNDQRNARRTDEVDTFFALPQSLGGLAPRLRRYLETIFVAGEWSSKPLFLRGIYFSSSMREGSALDQDLAEAIGVPVDELSDFKVWERDRSFFLRDLFLEKIFRERGLVTRATNTGSLLRKRRLLLYTLGFSFLAALLILSWLGLNTLKMGGKRQSDYWRAVSDIGWWDDKVWKQGLIARRNGAAYLPEVNQPKIPLADGGEVTLGEFQAKLRDVSTNPIAANLFFPTLADSYNRDSLKADQIAFETSVVKPLVDAARERLTQDVEPAAGDTARRQADALAALIQLEAAVINRGRGVIDETGVQEFAQPLLGLVAGSDSKLDVNLASVWAWTYSSNPAGAHSWPPSWLSDRKSATGESLTNFPALSSGLSQLIRNTTNAAATQLQAKGQLADFLSHTRAMDIAERAFLQAVREGLPDAAARAYKDLDAARVKFERWNEDKAQTGSALLKQGTLISAEDALNKAVGAGVAGALGRVIAANEAAMKQSKDALLFREIQAHLQGVQSRLNEQITNLFLPSEIAEMRHLDEAFLAKSDGATLYTVRFGLYKRLWDEREKGLPADIGEWRPGLKGQKFNSFLDATFKPYLEEVGRYSGGFKDGFGVIATNLTAWAQAAQAGRYFDVYFGNARTWLNNLGFPVLQDGSRAMSIDELKEASKTLKFIVDDDFGCALFRQYGAATNATWSALVAALGQAATTTRGLLGPSGAIGDVVVSLEPPQDPGAAVGVEPWRRGFIRRVHLGNGKDVVADREGGKLGVVKVSESVALGFGRQREQQSADAFSLNTGEWGALELVLKYKGARSAINPLEWSVAWPFDKSDVNPECKGAVRLKLQFERELPNIEGWPKQVR